MRRLKGFERIGVFKRMGEQGNGNNKEYAVKEYSFKEYSWPTDLYWQNNRVTVLQIFPMMGISILDFEHSHCFTDVFYVFSGKGILKAEGGLEIPLAAGTVAAINPHVIHRIVSDEKEQLKICNISLQFAAHQSRDKVPDVIGQKEDAMLQKFFGSTCRYSPDAEDLREVLSDALHYMNRTEAGDFVHFKNLMSDFLLSAVQKMTGLDAKKPAESGSFDSVGNALQLILYMREHFAEGIELNDVAEAMNYSPRQCQRLIQDFLGVSFSEYILAHRIRYAKHLLSTTGDPLEIIAEKSGFKSGKMFARQFKAITGMSPIAWRKQVDEQNGKDIGTDFFP